MIEALACGARDISNYDMALGLIVRNTLIRPCGAECLTEVQVRPKSSNGTGNIALVRLLQD